MFFSTTENIAKMIPYSQMYECFHNLRGDVNYIVMSTSNVRELALFSPMYKYYISVDRGDTVTIYTPISLEASSYNQRCQIELGVVYNRNQMQSKNVGVIAEDGHFMICASVNACNLNRELLKYILVLLENSAEPFRDALEDMGY